MCGHLVHSQGEREPAQALAACLWYESVWILGFKCNQWHSGSLRANNPDHHTQHCILAEQRVLLAIPHALPTCYYSIHLHDIFHLWGWHYCSDMHPFCAFLGWRCSHASDFCSVAYPCYCCSWWYTTLCWPHFPIILCHPRSHANKGFG